MTTKSATCKRCGNKEVLEQPDPQQGLHIICKPCGDFSLFKCDTLESAGIPAETIAQARKLAEIKKTTTTNLEHLVETNSKNEKRTCTTRERQLTQRALRRLEAEALTDPTARVSLLGTEDTNTVSKMISMTERLFLYMQEDLPVIERLQRENTAQTQNKAEEESALELRELQQQLRHKQETQETTKKETSKIENLRRKIAREQKEHEPKILEAQKSLADMQGSTETETQAAKARHEQFVAMTNVFPPHKQETPDSPSSYVRSLIEQMKKEINRLAGEAAKHQQYEKHK